MNTVAIMMPFPGLFKVFDAHSRDVFGRPSALGYCVLISVEGLENLGEYLGLRSVLKGVRCIDNDDMRTELPARVITNSGMPSTGVFKQHNVNINTLNKRK